MYGFRQLKDLFNKNKWTILISVWTTAIVYLHLHHAQKMTLATVKPPEPSPMIIQKEKNISEVHKPPKPVTQVKYYDVLINSYMRSGSTLTGMILGWRDDVFYLYEPLWKISRWAYWHGNDTVCRSDRLACRNVEPEKAVPDKTFPDNINGLAGGSLVMAKKILRKFYDCMFNDFERPVLHQGLTVKLGGPSWAQVASCTKGNGAQKICLHRYAPKKCKNAIHRVSKVLRLTTDLLADLLRDRPNLKIIHLFRDPRAIINSRNKTTWYPTHTPDMLIENAKSLCNKMLHDLREGKKLLKLYPDRFKFIYYEDLNENPREKALMLYKYLGMDLNESKYPHVSKMAVFSNSTGKTKRAQNTAYWWRMTLQWDIVQKMESVCSEVYKELGYKSISNLEDYRNLSISSVDIPKQYLLT